MTGFSAYWPTFQHRSQSSVIGSSTCNLDMDKSELQTEQRGSRHDENRHNPPTVSGEMDPNAEKLHWVIVRRERDQPPRRLSLAAWGVREPSTCSHVPIEKFAAVSDTPNVSMTVEASSSAAGGASA